MVNDLDQSQPPGDTLNRFFMEFPLALELEDTLEYAAELERLQTRLLELERMSSTDHLTGTWNRSYFDRAIPTEISRSERYRQALSLVLIDVDHFKRINDEHGHQCGDQVLRELTRVMQTHMRACDLVFRWGGDEFVVMTPGGGYRAAARLAENLRGRIAAHVFASVGHLTVSAGVAEHTATEDPTAWFRRLDEALYAAKMQGRNRIVVDRRGQSDDWAIARCASPLRLIWQEAYECGEPQIDIQHQQLFELANALIDASMSQHTPAGGFEPALNRLLTHIARHFADEEMHLLKRGYTHLRAHQGAHSRLLAKATELSAQCRSKTPKVGALVEFLAHEVVGHHILETDRDFFPLFRQAGYPESSMPATAIASSRVA